MSAAILALNSSWLYCNDRSFIAILHEYLIVKNH